MSNFQTPTNNRGDAMSPTGSRKKSIIMKKKRKQFSEIPNDINQTMNQSLDQPQFRDPRQNQSFQMEKQFVK